jgi:putative hydrolase of the HAD superfamily
MDHLFLPKAILLDLDDTILSFSAGAEEAWETVCRHFCERFPVAFTAGDMYRLVNESRQWYWSDPCRHKSGREHINQARREIMRNALAQLDIIDSVASDEAADEYSDIRDASMHLFEGSLDALSAFRSMGIRLGLLTNGGSLIQRRKLERFDLEKFFDVILIDQEIGISKPDPAIYHLALKQLELSAGDTMMVGDNLEWDIRGAQSAGIFAVWNDYLEVGLPPAPIAIPDYTVTSIRALATNLQKLA